ncbi:hypothetical protein N3K66_007587 [Trichothecium roseum]|uniref:Uncharacterized protein n=1 Tax=Trichothecium roseum TaxID=47278 RepID=A0ACC0UUF0_9HYPO|nr:hypothetical protein N3K66_007587 [Trichothecium roseum]
MALVHQPSPSSQSLTLLPPPPLPALPPSSTSDADADKYHLVRLHAASPCRHELTWEADHPYNFPPSGRALPRVPCFDGAGTVVLAPSSSPFQPGRDVFFWVDSDRPGCLAEYTLVKADEMVAVPRGVSLDEAAAAPLSAVTAWQGLFEHGTLSPPPTSSPSSSAAETETGGGSDSSTVQGNNGKTVLVTGATGGVGSWAVQLARLAGATVVTTSSPAKAPLASSLGAHHVLDYANLREEMAPWQDRVDLVLDTVGGEALAQCWRAVKPGEGYILSVSSEAPDDRKPEGLAKTVGKSEWFLVRNSQPDLAAIANLMGEKKIRSLVDSVFDMCDFEKAFAKLEEGHCTGKVVIRTRG